MNKRTSVLLLGVVVVASFSSGCASIVSGRNQGIRVTSEPPGAKVKAESGVSVTTPGRLTLARNKPQTLVAEFGQAEPQQKGLRTKVNEWLFGNILVGGIIGLAIDGVSGAWGKLTPDAVHFDFTESGQAQMQRKLEYLKSHPDIKKSERFAIEHDRPRKQMSVEALVATLGEPDQIVSEKKYEKYVYENREPRYYYLRNGTIKRIVK